MKGLAILLLPLLLLTSTLGAVADAEEPGCDTPLAVYSGPARVNAGAACALPHRTAGQPDANGDSLCDEMSNHLYGGACPAYLPPGDALDTRVILPGDSISVAYVGAIDGAPASLAAIIDGLGHAQTSITLVPDPDGLVYRSGSIAIVGDGALHFEVSMPDGRVIATTYTTLGLT